MRVKIIGAGSIGNHLSQAARSKGWNVVLCDKDARCLKAHEGQTIYPQRYGSWDDKIALHHVDDAPIGEDLTTSLSALHLTVTSHWL